MTDDAEYLVEPPSRVVEEVAWNALLLIEAGCDEAAATRFAKQWSDKCADLARAREVVEAAYGFCMGYDWNNGTAAKDCGYKRKLLSAVNAIKPVPDFDGKYRSAGIGEIMKRPEIDHELKVWPEYFDAIANGDKPFEIRKDDRGFREHDVLLLREYSPGMDEYTGREVKAKVTYCLRGNEAMGFAFGVRDGFVAMGIAVQR